ncbi:MAG TPA: endolytic transglycosylase MltG [bacterium]|nr:endolytic transglycosylase MltG [bacterium]
MRKIIFLIITISIIIVCYLFFDGIFIPLNNGVTTEFEIQSGKSSYEISQNLESSRLIKNAFFFDIYMKFSGKYKNILPGKFELSDSMNARQISNKITKKRSGVSFDEEQIKIIEGWNLKQIGKYLIDNGFCTNDEWKNLSNSNDYDYDFIKQKPKNTDLEGYLFPDTYRVYKDATCYDVINKLLKNFDNKLTQQMRNDIKNQGKSINEIISMASIVEKEVRSVDDMRIVSGIFWDRIKYGQALESCATLAYIIGENKAQYSYEDTRIKSIYNTYINKGLPPGPISNPGINAITSAIYPEMSEYNYFLTDLKTGNTIFSKTFEEHTKNKAKYLD